MEQAQNSTQRLFKLSGNMINNVWVSQFFLDQLKVCGLGGASKTREKQEKKNKGAWPIHVRDHAGRGGGSKLHLVPYPVVSANTSAAISSYGVSRRKETPLDRILVY